MTWETTWSQLSPAARGLLEILSWFAPDPIPQWVLDGEATRPIAARALSADPWPGGGGPREILDAEAARAGRRVGPAGASAGAGDDASAASARTGAPATAGARPGADGCRGRGGSAGCAHLAGVGRLAPHVRVLVAHADEAGMAEPTARLMNRPGCCHSDVQGIVRRGRAAVCAGAGDRRASRWGRTTPTSPGPQQPGRSCSRRTNRLAEAEPLMRRALAIDEACAGSGPPQRRQSLNNLALLQATQPAGARPSRCSRGRWRSTRRRFGPDHPDVAISLNNLAELLQATNRLARGRAAVSPGAGDRRAVARPGPPQRRHPPQQPGRLLPGHQPADGGRAAVSPGAGDRRAVVGPDHPDVAIDLNNLARLLQATNRAGRGRAADRRALAIDERC